MVLQGTLTRYVDDILTPIVLPMLSSRPGAIFNLRDSPNNFKDMATMACQVTRSFANRGCLGRAGKATALQEN
ncbi:hypothetical protein TNCV_4027101 [Trichonephila clavipes]|nr:hypothetical protein TNCV_4027101 [Trichonephila clavipes]